MGKVQADEAEDAVVPELSVNQTESQNNLDKLNDTVYLAHKGHGTGRAAQIVFIHGLQFQDNKNQFLDTWLSEDGRDLWPKSWLSDSFPTADIYLVRYDSCIWQDDKCGRLDMFSTAESLLQDLLLANIGQSPKHPVILIGQDVGGLVIKEICLQAFPEGSSSLTKGPMAHKKHLFLQQVQGVFYFSTPHGGLHHWDPNYQGELMKNLMVHNVAAARSNEAFRKMRSDYKWSAYGLGASSLGGEVDVKEAAARYDVDQFRMIPATAMNICRLKDRTSSSFQWLEDFIRDTISGFTNPDRVKLPFTADPRYVPLKQTTREIRKRLEDPDPYTQVVVLCGDAGTGKSSLTKYLALQYQLEEEEIGSKSMFWDGIFYFECGRGKEAVEVLRNMLRQLRVDEKRISSNDEGGMRLLLRERLQKLNALVIFDDVWDEDRVSLVQKVVVPEAREVKYLLSSQQSPHGWHGYRTCQIEGISLAIAQQIIIKHVSLRDEEIPRDDEARYEEIPIPKDDEKIVNEIIQMTEFHPLALATIASSVRVGPRGRVRRADWEDVRQNLLFYLAEEEPASKATIFDESYPRSMFAAMMFAVDLLCKRKDESLYLLSIMALFENPFRTAVIHMFILCTRGPQVYKHVYRLIQRLQDRQLVQDASALQISEVRKELQVTAAGIPYPHPPRITDNLLYLKMHSLRQQFILTCGRYDSNFKNSVEVINTTLAPFLIGTSNSGPGPHEFEHPEEHFSPAVLSTALCALYGIARVRHAANDRLRSYRLRIQIPAGNIHKGARGGVEVRMTYTELKNYDMLLRSSVPYEKLLQFIHPRISLELLMEGIGEPMASTSTRVQSALQKVVWQYMFRLKIDDDNLSFLISKGYDCALHFLVDYLDDCQHYPRSLAAAASLLRTKTQSNMYTRNLTVLSLLQHLALLTLLHSTPEFEYVNLDVFDLEVLINVFQLSVRDSQLDMSTICVQIFCCLAHVRKIGFRLIFLLRTTPGMQEAIKSVKENIVEALNTTSILKTTAEEISHQRLAYTIYQLDTTLGAVRLLCDLWPGTFGDEDVAATVESISEPFKALIRLFPHIGRDRDVILPAFSTVRRLSNLIKDQKGRSPIWPIPVPGAIEGIISVLRIQLQQQPYARQGIAEFGLSLLAHWTIRDDRIRSYLSSYEGFLDMLVEVVGDYKGDLKSDFEVQFYAVLIIEKFVTSDETTASVLASLAKLHQVLCDTVMCTRIPTSALQLTVPVDLGHDIGAVHACIHRPALTVLLYLGYRIGVRAIDHITSSGCCILQAVTPMDSSSAVGESSHALKVQNAFESLFGIIDDSGQRVAQVEALELVRYLVQNHSSESASAHIYAMPTAATRLSLLLHEDDASVQYLALEVIVELAHVNGFANLADYLFLQQVVLIPGVIERIVEFMGFDWKGRESATVFLSRYLAVHPESAHRILAVRDVILSVVLSLQNKDQDNIKKVNSTLYFLHLLSQASGSVSFFLSIRGSVEAVVELLAHNTQKLVEQPAAAGPGLPHRTARIIEQERTELLCSITYCLEFLSLLAAQVEEAVDRMVGTGRVFDPLIDLFDKTQQGSCGSDPCQEEQKWPSTELIGGDFDWETDCLDDWIWERMQGRATIDLLGDKQQETIQGSGADRFRRKLTGRALEFLFLLASRRRNALPEKLVEMVSSVLQDHVDLLTMTNINGTQVLRVLESLLSLVVRYYQASKPFVARAPGALERLISLSVPHEQTAIRVCAINIVNVCYVPHFPENAFTHCLLKVLDVLPEIVDRLRQCLVEEDSVTQQRQPLVLFLAAVAYTGTNHDKVEIRYRIRSKLTSLINTPVLHNLAGLLQRDVHESIHLGVICIISFTTSSSPKRMLQIVQIPGTLERIVRLVCSSETETSLGVPAFGFVRNLLSVGQFYAHAPHYLLKCLVHVVVSTRMGKSMASTALHLLGLCASRNKIALHYLIDMLHKGVRCTLRAEAMNYLIAHVSVTNPELPTRTLLASLQSLAYDPTRYGSVEPAAWDLQVEVLCILASLVQRSPQSQWRIAKYVTGICAGDLCS